MCDVIIADDINKMSDITLLTSGLNELFVMSKHFFVSQGHKGEVLKYKHFTKLIPVYAEASTIAKARAVNKDGKGANYVFLLARAVGVVFEPREFG